MTKQEKQALDKKHTIAYWSEMGGVEIKDIQYGIEDYIECVAGTMSETKSGRTYHRLKINIAPSGEYYVRLYGKYLMIDDAIRNF